MATVPIQRQESCCPSGCGSYRLIEGLDQPLLAPHNLLQLQEAIPVAVQEVVQQVYLVLPHLQGTRQSSVEVSHLAHGL